LWFGIYSGNQFDRMVIDPRLLGDRCLMFVSVSQYHKMWSEKVNWDFLSWLSS